LCFSIDFFVPDLRFLVLFSAIGSLVIVIGLYFMLWGKNKEVDENDGIDEITEAMEDDVKDLELQPYNPFNGNGKHHEDDDKRKEKVTGRLSA